MSAASRYATREGAERNKLMIGENNRVETEPDVWFIPFEATNPYQRDLARHLGTLNITVGERRNLAGIVRESFPKAGRAVMHLHWLPRFNRGWRGWVRALIYVGQLHLLRLLGRRIVWTVHNLYHHEAVCRTTDQWVYRQLTGIADGMIAHSPAAREEVIQVFKPKRPEKIATIFHGNYLESYENVVGTAAARTALGVTDATVVLLFFGWVRPYKGVKEMIRAFRGLQGSGLRLVIAGQAHDSGFVQELEREAEGDERVIFRIGRVPDEEIQLYMNAADAVVLPYREILTSGAVILAMSFGRACIAPRIGCIPDLLDEHGAVLYDPEDGDGLTKSLQVAVDLAGCLAEMGERNLEKARAWGWDRVAAETAGLYARASHR